MTPNTLAGTGPATVPAPPPLAARAASVGSSPVREILALTQRPEVISFAGGLPAPELFAAEAIRAAYDRVLAEQPQRVLQYSTSEGDPALRGAVAQRLGERGLPTGPDELLVTTGSQQALTLLATVLLEPGDTVLVEDPTYLAALQCFGFAGARVVPVHDRRRGRRPGGAGGGGGARAAQDALCDPHLPEPDRTHPPARPPPGRRGDRRAVRDVDRGGRSLRRAAVRGRARAVGRLAAAGRRPHGAAGQLLQGHGARTATRLAARTGRTAPRLRHRQAGAGTALFHRRPGGSRPLSGGQRPGRASDAGRDAYRDRRDALLDGLSATLPPGSTWNHPQGGMLVWARLPGRITTRRSCCTRRSRRMSPTFRVRPSSRALRTLPRCGCRSPRTPLRRSGRGCGGSAGYCGRPSGSRPGPERGGRGGARAAR